MVKPNNKKIKILNICKNVQQLELLYRAGSSVKWCKHFGKQLGKKLNIRQLNVNLLYHLKEIKAYAQKRLVHEGSEQLSSQHLKSENNINRRMDK